VTSAILKKELPMPSITRVAAALQALFGPLAVQAAEVSGVIVRRRKLTPLSLARTFVLGFLQKPTASDEELARLAAQAGTAVTPQAIEQRHTPKLVRFLKELFGLAARQVVAADKVLAPLLRRFSRVVLLDSSTIALPDCQRAEYPGCGGSYGGGAAALKLQTELDLSSGAVTHVEVEAGRTPDAKSGRQVARRGPGSLRVTDLGYFSLAVFAALTQAGEYFLSRLQFGTHVFGPGGTPPDLLAWLARDAAPFVDGGVVLGQGQRLPCRLLAWRVPAEQAARRRQKLRRETRERYHKGPTAAGLAWCDWTILVTNVPGGLLTPREAVVLYRARWQIELLFKRWKSQDRVALLRGSTAVRQMVGVWARLLAALVQHWLVVGCAWGDATKSLSKVAEAVRAFVGRLLAGLDDDAALLRVLRDLCAAVASTCRRNRRSKPGTFELLNDVDRLDYELT
jgi:hypothetical protein